MHKCGIGEKWNNRVSFETYNVVARKKGFVHYYVNQRTNGPVNAHLISGLSVSTKHTLTKPGLNG